VWSGTAASWEDLSVALTGSWVHTRAEGIWSDEAMLYVVGSGMNLGTNRWEALLWTRPVPAPSALLLQSLGGLIAARRRRS